MIKKLIYDFFKKFGIMIGMNPIDPAKVDAFLEALNRREGRNSDNPVWVAVDGVSSFLSANISDTGSVTFQGNQGYLVKAFLNRQTGEVRTYTAKLFAKD